MFKDNHYQSLYKVTTVRTRKGSRLSDSSYDFKYSMMNMRNSNCAVKAVKADLFRRSDLLTVVMLVITVLNLIS